MSRIALVCWLTLAAVIAGAQSWMTAYENGLKAARAANWAAARAAFQQAIAYRPEDVAGGTTLPGPVTDQRRWRDGAPYSPNFLAAYCEYRLGLSAGNDADAKPAFQTAATEFESLLAKGQTSKETFYFLGQIYARLGDTARRQDLEAKFAQSKPTFKVDAEVVTPEERTILGLGSSTSTGAGTGPGPTITVIKGGQTGPATPLPQTPGANMVVPAVGPVPIVSTKFALIIGNSTSKMPDAISYGADDAQAVREGLIANAGYAQSNVDLVLNATKDQLAASAKALADRVPEGATVFIFFAGSGVNANGKDYLAGVEASSTADTGAMYAKSDLYQLFMNKAAKIYAFYEVPRPISNGYYFGQEIPLVGAIAQTQSTIPGEGIYSMQRNGHTVGVFADAFVTTLLEIRSNQIPITEFGWQLFNRIRGGGPNSQGGGGRQVPTLPVLTHLGPDDRF